jgi:MarR family transcriptional regulator, organic hydroperoxide resistance regulator
VRERNQQRRVSGSHATNSSEELARQIELRLNAIRQLLRQPLEAEFARGHLTGPQRSVMSAIVSAKEPLQLREITRAVGLAQSTVSGIVERLVQAGMLVRTEDPLDARATRIATSPTVREFIEKRMPQMTLSPLAAALRRAGGNEAQAIYEALSRLEDLLKEVDAAPEAEKP